MYKYEFTFELFGKTMKTTISAGSERAAKEKLHEQIIKNVRITETVKTDPTVDALKDLFNMH